MRFWHFMIAVLVGKNLCGLLLMYLGSYVVYIPYLT